jgi:hypothetical protein
MHQGNSPNCYDPGIFTDAQLYYSTVFSGAGEVKIEILRKRAIPQALEESAEFSPVA